MGEYDDRLDAQLAAAREMVYGGQLEEAWIFLNRLDLAFPDSPDVLALMGDCTLRAGDAEHAWEMYDHAIELDPTWSGIWSARARCSLELCNLPAARSDSQQAMFLDSANAEAHYARAIIAEFDGQPKEAEAAYLQAYRLDKDNFHRPFRVSSDEEFNGLVRKSFEEITIECGLPIEVVLACEPLPVLNDFAETGLSPLSPSFLDLPPEEEGVFTEIEPPPRIVIYRLNVERLSRDFDELKREIELSLVNEVMNLFDEYGEPIPDCLESRGDEFIH